MDNLLAATEEQWSPSKRNKLFAWGTHFFTASGAIWGFLAILAITHQQWLAAFVWMAAATFVDSFDGLLARRARVKEVVPQFDGALLDNMIDYLNYVIIPAFFIYKADFLPPRFALFGVCCIMISSAYQFCQDDAKTDDHYFKGFPSYWNILAFYLLFLGLSPWVNWIITVGLAILVFVPIKYVYPSRTEQFQRVTMIMSLLWGIICITMLAQYPNEDKRLVWLSLIFAVYYIAISLHATFTRRES
ncbi:MAG: CDP-alcohol phosphatidyltransferase family protein [Caldilineaceae bacterium]|nr:CDP-alcohol phosphatidyltransferase family protein [Caldilineaceae bacterium]MCB0096603.1 CDP-alcohol phosphatidyltransferase family protein [Caldilineaceae bacterium]MCB9156364.1 CDP-alcohol phosphatidyltransferase family protein [Caldilineaceae bacterium]